MTELKLNQEYIDKILNALRSGPLTEGRIRRHIHYKAQVFIEPELSYLIKTGRVRKTDNVYHLPAPAPVFGSFPYTHEAAVGRVKGA